MKKFIALICFVTMLLFTQGCEKNYTYAVYELNISERCVYNDAVGDDWETQYSCYGSTVYNGYRWTVPIDSTNKIYLDTAVIENDKYPDIGKESVVIELTDGFETSTTITVTESDSRYAGNKAIWEITYKIELVNRL